MGQRYLVDSNVIIDYQANMLPSTGNHFIENVLKTDFRTSIIVKIEVLGFKDIPEKIKAAEDFLGKAYILSLNEEIAQQAIILKRQYKKLRLGDAIIAATALVNDLIVITRNTDDFKNIDGLNFINPWLL